MKVVICKLWLIADFLLPQFRSPVCHVQGGSVSHVLDLPILDHLAIVAALVAIIKKGKGEEFPLTVDLTIGDTIRVVLEGMQLFVSV